MKNKQSNLGFCFCSAIVALALATTGCQSNFGGSLFPFGQSSVREAMAQPPSRIPLEFPDDMFGSKSENSEYSVSKSNVSVGNSNLRPSDLMDAREFKSVNRRQGTARIFESGDSNSPGHPPRVVVRPPTVEETTQITGTTPVTYSDETTQTVYRGQDPGSGGGSFRPANGSPQDDEKPVRQATYQYPESQGGPAPGSIFNPVPNSAVQLPTGNINEMNPQIGQTAPGGIAQFPTNNADVDIYVGETQTGRINFGGAYNSDNGIVGQFIIDERNFDIWAFPRSFGEIFDGTAWRGNGQSFRLELVPGRDVQRYLVSFGEPYLFDLPVSLNVSAYLFDRNYFDWDEQRLGGRVALGYRLTHDLSVSAGVRAENVDISNPRLGTSPQLNAAVGDTDLFVGHVSLVRDTRDHPFLATEGSYLSMTYSVGFGEFDYSRGDLDFRTYRLMYERPDRSGRHTISFGTKLGFSGSQTPVFENYYAGGFSTMRGYDFRGASPVEGGVIVGGEFQWLNSLEYMFPLTADDMIRGVLFCDFGTVEENITINSDNFRVAPGFGFRVHMPSAGIGAPLAFDFAFPVASAPTDQEQVFSFYLGVLR